jgi:hypothetical protein
VLTFTKIKRNMPEKLSREPHLENKEPRVIESGLQFGVEDFFGGHEPREAGPSWLSVGSTRVREWLKTVNMPEAIPEGVEIRASYSDTSDNGQIKAVRILSSEQRAGYFYVQPIGWLSRREQEQREYDEQEG